MFFKIAVSNTIAETVAVEFPLPRLPMLKSKNACKNLEKCFDKVRDGLPDSMTWSTVDFLHLYP